MIISRSWPSRLGTTMPKPLSTGCSRSGAEPTVDLLPERRTVNPLTGATRYKFPCAPRGRRLRAAACGEAALAGSSYADVTACGRLHQPSQATSRGDC